MNNGNMPAMPTPPSARYGADPHDGMTKRELIAMHCLAAMISTKAVPSNEIEVTYHAINYADALLKELDRSR